jgi:hypothetical protein
VCRCDLLKNTSGNARLLLYSYLLLVILWITLDTHTGTSPRGIRRSQIDGPYGHERRTQNHRHNPRRHIAS